MSERDNFYQFVRTESQKEESQPTPANTISRDMMKFLMNGIVINYISNSWQAFSIPTDTRKDHLPSIVAHDTLCIGMRLLWSVDVSLSPYLLWNGLFW